MDALAAEGEHAKLPAGGHSRVPALALRLLGPRLDPPGDLDADGAAKFHLARVLLGRAVRALCAAR